MTFDGLLDQACKSAGLPDMARVQLPSALGEKTKRSVLTLSPEELGHVLNTAIEAVNHGSVESIDVLVRMQIER